MNTKDSFPQPRAVEAEQALLGAAMYKAAHFDAATDLIRDVDLYENAHRAIWRAMAKLREEGKDLKPHLVVAALGLPSHEPFLGEMTVGQYIARLAAEGIQVDNPGHYANAVRDAAHARRLALVAWDTNEALREGNVDIESLAVSMVTQADSIMQARSRFTTPRITLGQAAREAIDAMQRAAAGEKPNTVTTGLDVLDDLLGGGYECGGLTIVAARPSMGKTALALCSSISAGMAGEGVYMASLEMKGEPLGQRAISDMLYDDGRGPPVAYRDIRLGKVPPTMDARLGDAYARLDALPVMIEQQGGLAMGQILTRARQVRDRMADKGIKLKKLLVDHLGLVRPSDRYAGARHRELAEITAEFRNGCKELDVAGVMLCQLNRAVETRENKRPTLSDLRESGSIEENADAVLFLYRAAYYLERAKEEDVDKENARIAELAQVQNILEINCAKQRQGPTRTIEVFADMASNALRDVAGRRRR